MLTNWHSDSYKSDFREVVGDYTVTGSLVCDKDKNINSINGVVTKDGSNPVSFTGYRAGERLKININGIDPELIAAYGAAIDTALVNIAAEVAEEN